MRVLIIVLKLFDPSAVPYAKAINYYANIHEFDPLLVVAVMYKESRFKNRCCYRGSYGLMQIQLKERSCEKTEAEALRRKLYNPWVNIRDGVRMMAWWRKWGKGKSYHWLLHYNQGFGKCIDGGKECKFSKRKPITTGKIGGYAIRVLEIYQRLKTIERKHYEQQRKSREQG